MRPMRSGDNVDDLELPPGPYDASPEDDELWFAPISEPNAEDAHQSPLPRANDRETIVIDDWRDAERALVPQLAKVAQRLGALDDRLGRGPVGWADRLAMLEASQLSWFTGHRVPLDKLSLWLELRAGSVEFDDVSLSKTGWAYRRLSSGPGPEAGLAEFLARRDVSGAALTLDERLEGWRLMQTNGRDLHPFTRACLGHWMWPMVGIGPESERLEAAVIAARQAAAYCVSGCRFVPLALGGAVGLRAIGPPRHRLKSWLDGMESGISAAMRELDLLEDWLVVAGSATADLSGKTPRELIRLMVKHVVMCAPVAERLTGVSRAAAQRNLVLLENRGLLREVTGQGRWRFWRIRDARS